MWRAEEIVCDIGSGYALGKACRQLFITDNRFSPLKNTLIAVQLCVCVCEVELVVVRGRFCACSVWLELCIKLPVKIPEA
jgi:hypothetical protein